MSQERWNELAILYMSIKKAMVEKLDHAILISTFAANNVRRVIFKNICRFSAATCWVSGVCEVYSGEMVSVTLYLPTLSPLYLSLPVLTSSHCLSPSSSPFLRPRYPPCFVSLPRVIYPGYNRFRPNGMVGLGSEWWQG